MKSWVVGEKWDGGGHKGKKGTFVILSSIKVNLKKRYETILDLYKDSELGSIAYLRFTLLFS